MENNYTNVGSDLSRYINGQMTTEEQVDFERKAMEDPMLMIAIKGYQKHPKGDHQANLAHIKSKISRSQKQTKGRKTFKWLQYAASIALVAGMFYGVWYHVAPETMTADANHNTHQDNMMKQDNVELESVKNGDVNVLEEPLANFDEPSTPAQSPVQLPEPTDKMNAVNYSDILTANNNQEPDKKINQSSQSHQQQSPPSSLNEEAESSDLKDDNLAHNVLPRTIQDDASAASNQISNKKESQEINQNDALNLDYAAVTDQRLESNAIIQGTVVDELNQPIPFANISTADGIQGTTSDINGNFSLSATKNGDTLIASYLGFADKILVIDRNRDATYNFILQSEAMVLDEVQVTDLNQATKRKQRAGSRRERDGIERPFTVEILTTPLLDQYLYKADIMRLEKEIADIVSQSSDAQSGIITYTCTLSTLGRLDHLRTSSADTPVFHQALEVMLNNQRLEYKRALDRDRDIEIEIAIK